MKLAVFGLGKCLAAVFASKHYRVLGTDVDRSAVKKVKRGEAPVQETGLDQLFRANAYLLNADNSAYHVAMWADIIFVVVPTPSDTSDRFSLKHILEAAGPIGRAIADCDDRKVVVIVSTVMPADMESSVVPALERASGKTCPKDFGVCYNPEFIALGSVIADMQDPDFVLIGESDAVSGEQLEALYRDIVPMQTPIERTSFINAELAKLAINTFVTTKISYANMMANLGRAFPGADAHEVCRIVGNDHRIGHRCLGPALSFGGPCFPRDVRAMIVAAGERGANVPLAYATLKTNHDHHQFVLNWLRGAVHEKGVVGVLGLSYKPFTHIIEESAAFRLARELAAFGHSVRAFDPAVKEMPPSVLGTETLGDCVELSDVLAVAVPWPEFRKLQESPLLDKLRGKTVLDCWRLLDEDKMQGVNYVLLGRE
jgi:UDPglucose 6-dehydrogenase